MTEYRNANHYVRAVRQQKFPKQQVEAAKAAGMSQSYLSQLETGYRNLSAGAALKLERGWGLKRYDLLRWVGDDTDDDLRSRDNDIPGYLCRVRSPPRSARFVVNRPRVLSKVA
jgi:transcriptional regulator with XRE-family HTH domain